MNKGLEFDLEYWTFLSSETVENELGSNLISWEFPTHAKSVVENLRQDRRTKSQKR